MIIVRLIGTYTYNLFRRGPHYALFSVLMRILGEFYPRVGIYNDGQVLYVATNEWHLTQCMTSYLNEETDTDTDDSTSDLGE